MGLIGRRTSVTLQEIDVLEQAFIDAYTNIDCGDRDLDDVTIVTDPNIDSTIRQGVCKIPLTTDLSRTSSRMWNEHSTVWWRHGGTHAEAQKPEPSFARHY